MKLCSKKVGNAVFILLLSFFAEAQIRPVVVSSVGGLSIQIKEKEQVIFSSLNDRHSLLIAQPSGIPGIEYQNKTETGRILSLSGAVANGLKISESYKIITSGLIERTVTVKAESDQRYYLDFGRKTAQPGDYFSFLGEEKKSINYTPSCPGSEFGNSEGWQTFPSLGIRSGDKLYGIIGDTPGLWENRSFMRFDKENKKLVVVQW
jgi:hypothetical protein